MINKNKKIEPLYYTVNFISGGTKKSITINAFHVTQVSPDHVVADNGIKVYVGGGILSIDSCTEDDWINGTDHHYDLDKYNTDESQGQVSDESCKFSTLLPSTIISLSNTAFNNFISLSVSNGNLIGALDSIKDILGK